MQGETLKFI